MTQPISTSSDRPTASAGSAGSAGLALVTGGSRGLGLLIARQLGARGYRLVVCARDSDELDRARDDLTARGYPAVVTVCDVAEESAVEEMITRVEREHGAIDVLICVAGIIQVGPLTSVSREEFRSAVDIMTWGPVNAALAVAPGMRRRRRGRIGIVSSVGGLIAVPHLVPYSTAKFAAIGFGRGLRAELAGTGVTVTVIAPGLMRTGSHRRARFVGRQGAEYAWFAAAASLPLISMDAERAARRIVNAVLGGRAVVVLTPLAAAAMRLNGLFPNLTAALLDATARLLPRPPSEPDTTAVPGWVARDQLRPGRRRIVDRLTRLGDRAAEDHNE